MTKLGKFAAACAAVLCAFGAFGGAKRSAEFTVNGYAGSTELANFPVLVRLAEPSESAGITGFEYEDFENPETGADLWFSLDAAGGEVIPHEIDEWHADGTSLVWVSLPKLKKGATFYMHYGDDAPPEYAPSNVWLNADYVGVWHMNEPSGDVADSTGHGLTAVPKGSRAATDSIGVADGVIGTARQNSQAEAKGKGTDNCYLQVANSDALNVINCYCTVSQWIKFTDVNCQYVRVYSRKTGYSETPGYECEMSSSSTVLIRAGGASGPSLSISPVGAWAHFVAVYDNMTCYGYGNGGATTAVGSITPIGQRTGVGFGIGSNASGAEPCINGWMDEYRLRRVASSADWVKAEYDTAKDAAFLSASPVFSPDQVITVGGAPAMYGEPVPGYGAIAGCQVGTQYVFDAPEFVYLNDALNDRMVCTGWKLYDIETGELVAETAQDGVKTNCTFTFEKAVKLDWQWQRQCFLDISASGGVADESFWANEGESVSITQTADAGRTFYGWDGDLDSVGVSHTNATLSFTVRGPLTLKAMYTGGEVIVKTYVGGNGGRWDVAANWSPAGVPTVSDAVTIPDGKRVVAGHRIFAASVTLNGSAAISQGGSTTAINETILFTENSTYGSSASYGRKADSYTDETAYLSDVLGDVTLNGSSQWLLGGHNSHPYKTLRVGGNLTLAGTAQLAVYAGKGDMANAPEKGGARLTVAGKATIGAGTVIDAYCNVSINDTAPQNDYGTGAYVLLEFGETEIAAGGTIRSRLGIGEYTDPTLKSLGTPPLSGNWLAGGGHGGRGGATSSGGTVYGPYDYELAPILPGACGSQQRSLGGGVVRLDTSSLVLNGTISANACYGTPQHESGAPAGGSVWITCDTYAIGTSAKISADGLAAKAFESYDIGGGAGGRIALATGLHEAEKTELARTGTSAAISTASSLTFLYRGNVSVSGKTGVRNGMAGEDGTAVLYRYVDPSQAFVSIATSSPIGEVEAFTPAVNTDVAATKGETFTATAPATALAGFNVRRVVTGWKALLNDGTEYASGEGTTAEIESVPGSLSIVWQCDRVEYKADIAAIGDGAVTGGASGWFAEGTELVLTATPAAGGRFLGWICGRFQSPSEAASTTLSVRMDRGLRLAAVFTGARDALLEKTFVGESGSEWETDANWSPAGVPGFGDAAVIPEGVVVKVSESAVAGSLTLGEGAGLSVFGAVAVYSGTASVIGRTGWWATLGRNAKSYGLLDMSPSVETVNELMIGPNAWVAVGGLNQRVCSFVRSYGDIVLEEGAKMSVYAGSTEAGRIEYLDGTGRISAEGAFSLGADAQLDLIGYNPEFAEYATLSCVPIECGSFEVAAGAKVAANFPCYLAPSALLSMGGGANNGLVAGAGHGGKGGDGIYTGGALNAGGSAYDSMYAPVYPGHHGRYDNQSNMMCVGGGVIRVRARQICIAGELNADATGTGPYEYGGASGGSIWLVCDAFSAEPTARLSAKGMNGSTYSSYACGGGAGGRISICEGLSATKYAKMLHANSDKQPSGVAVFDQLADGAKYAAIVDVSGGKGRSGTDAEDGETGTAVLVKANGLVLMVR